MEGFEIPILNEELLLEQEVEFPIAESGLRLTTGKAAFVDDFMRKIPVFAVNSYGSGLGVYLNCTFDVFAGNPAESVFIKDPIARLAGMPQFRRMRCSSCFG